MAARSKRSPKQREGRPTYGRRRRVPWIPIGAVVAVAITGFFLVRSLEIGAPGERIAVTGVGQHPADGQPIAYNSVPPAGGPHWPTASAWGAYDAAIPDERAVHNLEHGGVVVSYNAIPAEQLNALKALLQTYPRDRFNEVKLIIRPYDRIPSGTFVLAAWG